MAEQENEMRPSYDFSKAKRGKFAARYAAGSNVVVLEPDVAKAFSDEKAVNEALREVLAKGQGRQLTNNDTDRTLASCCPGTTFYAARLSLWESCFLDSFDPRL